MQSQPQKPIRVNSKKIRVLIIEKGLRPVDLARKFKVTRAAVSYAINGKRPASLLLGKLAKDLRVRLEEIILNGENGGHNGRNQG